MKVLKGHYEDGTVRLSEPAPEDGPSEVEVIFFDKDERRWSELLNDPTPRPALEEATQQVLADHKAGKTSRLDFDRL